MGIFNRNKENGSTNRGASKSNLLPISKLYFDLRILDETDIPFITHSVPFHQISLGIDKFVGEGFIFYHKKLKMLFICPNKWADLDLDTVFYNESPETRLVASNHELYTSSLSDLGDSGIFMIRTHDRGSVSVFTHDLDSAKKMNSYLNRYCIKKRDFGSA